MFKNIFNIALTAIFTNKSRSFLTTLGVIIGVGSVVMLTAIGNGLTAYITEQFEELGANTIIVLPGEIFTEGGGFSEEGQLSSAANSKLRLRDLKEVESLREFVILAAPLTLQSDKASFLTENKSISVVGTTPDYQTATSTKIEKGRWFSDTDVSKSNRVAVIGYEVAQDLFGQVDPIGKKIKIGGQSYSVVGMAEKVGATFGGPSFDDYVFTPITSYQKQYDTSIILRIIVKTKSTDNIPEAIAAVEKQLGKRLDDDEFSVIDQSQILGTITQILGVLTMGLGGIASISLLVGGIGIMNIMLVSVTERTREIGLRKALGATPNLILLQFLIEAALLSLLGGGIGIGLAFLGTLAIQPVFPAKITFEAVMLAFGVSSAVGLIFGAAPARRAAKLSPIEALRYE